MLKNEIDVLVIAHNISVAFDYLSIKRQKYFVNQLRTIEQKVCEEASAERNKQVQLTEKGGENG